MLTGMSDMAATNAQQLRIHRVLLVLLGCRHTRTAAAGPCNMLAADTASGLSVLLQAVYFVCTHMQQLPANTVAVLP